MYENATYRLAAPVSLIPNSIDYSYTSKGASTDLWGRQLLTLWYTDAGYIPTLLDLDELAMERIKHDSILMEQSITYQRFGSMPAQL